MSSAGQEAGRRGLTPRHPLHSSRRQCGRSDRHRRGSAGAGPAGPHHHGGYRFCLQAAERVRTSGYHGTSSRYAPTGRVELPSVPCPTRRSSPISSTLLFRHLARREIGETFFGHVLSFPAKLLKVMNNLRISAGAPPATMLSSSWDDLRILSPNRCKPCSLPRELLLARPAHPQLFDYRILSDNARDHFHARGWPHGPCRV